MNKIILVFLTYVTIVYSQDTVLTKIDKYVENIMTKTNTPGLSIAVINQNENIYTKGFGKLDIDSNLKVNENTLFAIGSISKSFTTACLAQLVEDGKIHWNDKVIDFLPEFRLFDPWVTREITISDLLLHRTGYAQVSFGTLYYGSSLSRNEILDRLQYLKPISSFRSTIVYQNFTYMIAGLIIEKVTGSKWEEFLRENIFAPLNMNRSFAKFQKTMTSKNLASPHILRNKTLKKVNHRNYENIGPAGAIYSSAIEMAKYMIFILNKMIIDTDTLVSQPVFDEILKPYELFYTSSEGYNHYGFGWFITNWNGYKIVHHSGGVDGFSSEVMLVPELKIGVAVLTNQEISGTSLILKFIIGQYLGLAKYDLSEGFFQWLQNYLAFQEKHLENLDNNRIPETKPSLKLKDFAGVYFDEMYGEIYVTFENEKLKLSFEHSKSFIAQLNHYHFNVFRLKWFDPTLPEGLITFKLNSKNEIEGFEFDIPKLLDADFKELNIKKKR